MATYKIVKTSNFDADYYDEKFVENLPVITSSKDAWTIANACNALLDNNGPDYYKAVEEGYVLRTANPNER